MSLSSTRTIVFNNRMFEIDTGQMVDASTRWVYKKSPVRLISALVAAGNIQLMLYGMPSLALSIEHSSYSYSRRELNSLLVYYSMFLDVDQTI